MADQVFLGNFSGGLTLNKLPFVIDNDSFPYLYNFYVWRGRVKRKRGTASFGRLTRQMQSVATATPPLNWQVGTIMTLDGLGDGSATLSSLFSLESSSIEPGSIQFSDGTNTYLEPTTPNGTLTGTPTGIGTINYSTSVITITGGAPGGTVTGYFAYYPILPSMALEDFVSFGTNLQYPLLLAFDTKYSYQFFNNGTSKYFFSTSFYKATNVPITWSGQDYQKFWTTNYSGALWATNNKPGFHYLNAIYNAAGGSSGTTTIGFTLTYPLTAAPYTTLVIGDVLWFNEWGSPATTISANISSITVSGGNTAVITVNSTTGLVVGDIIVFEGLTTNPQLNGQKASIFALTLTTVTIKVKIGVNGTYSETGTITTIPNSQTSTTNNITGIVSNVSGAASGNYSVTFTGAQTVGGSGIVQLLTNSVSGQDGIRWYDGDMTGGLGLPSSKTTGWVNFAPPLTNFITTINNTPADKYYLVGALIILPFKDRLLFFSPWIQSTTNGSIVQLVDTVIWSWNGTPYYTTSDINTSSNVPVNQTADATVYYTDQTGKGGWRSAGIAQPIVTVSPNEDVLLVGFGGDGRKTRFVYTGNDLEPFLFYTVNSEFPSSATFSAITMDKGVLDMGQYGFAMTDQQSSQRFDLQIPDSVFQVQALNNGILRVNAVRDFYKEWVYFSYPVYGSPWKFPTQTFFFNYRDNTWAVFYENFTAHGTYRSQTKKSWLTTGFASWNVWNEPWNSGSQSPQFPSIIAGNPQGFVLTKGVGTGEGISGDINAIANSNGVTQITSLNHCVQTGDYLLISKCLGTTDINGLIGRVDAIPDANTFVIDLQFPSGTYLGLGVYTRLSQPLLQTKQFPTYWEQGRQVRLSAQKYLMDFTPMGQVTVNIYLSQNPTDPWNNPDFSGIPNGLVYSQLLYTCPESTNLGLIPASSNMLNPANTNLQMPVAENQFQIWHRMNTSLIGDSVQIGMTLNDDQMRNFTYATDEITLHGIHLTMSPAGHLA